MLDGTTSYVTIEPWVHDSIHQDLNSDTHLYTHVRSTTHVSTLLVEIVSGLYLSRYMLERRTCICVCRCMRSGVFARTPSL